jgi:ADP-heptose:LPS heptosyltransferase
MRKLILTTNFALGDIVLMTAAIRDLHQCYPGAFLTDVRTPCGALWNYNPYLCHLDENDPEVETVALELPLIDWSNTVPYHVLEGFIDNLNQQLGLHIRCTQFKGDLHLTPAEKRGGSPIERLTGRPVPYWLIFAGGRHEITIKWWDRNRYQEVVNHFRGRIQFVQAGSESDHHPKLEGTIDLRGQTSLRELFRLIYHCEGVLCGVTGPMHLAAAVETKTRAAGLRPCVVIAGGREPVQWESYPGHQVLHTIGALPCCAQGGCWKTRTVPLGDGSPKDKPGELCVNVQEGLPACMRLITPEEVIRRIETYFTGSRLRYLAPPEAAAGRRAVRRTARNPLDARPLPIGDARYAVEEFRKSIGPCPEHFSGRGMVMSVWDLGSLPQTWILIRKLRQLGCGTAIELWHWRRDKRMALMERPLGALNVRLVDGWNLRKTAVVLGAFGAQACSLVHSSYAEVLLLDPQLDPVANPDRLFGAEEYRQTGALVWPGVPARRIQPQTYYLCGLEPSRESPMAAMPLLADKGKCWPALALWLWYHEQAHLYYPHTRDGQDAAHLAFCKAGVRCARASIGQGGDVWNDLSGSPMFEGVRQPPANLFLSGLPPSCSKLERRWIEELRQHLCVESAPANPLGRFGGPAPRPQIQRAIRSSAAGRRTRGGSAFSVVTLHDRKMARVGRLTAGVLREYARRHGYGYVCHRRMLDPQRHPSWNKVLAVRECLEKQREGWVMWVDADAMVMNHRLNAQNFILPGYDLVCASDGNGLVAGIFMIRCCPWSLRFLDTVFFLGDVKCDPDGCGPKWEQNTIKHILKNFDGFEEHALLLPQRQLNSDLRSFEPGDFILHLGLLSNGNRERIFRQALAWIVK